MLYQDSESVPGCIAEVAVVVDGFLREALPGQYLRWNSLLQYFFQGFQSFLTRIRSKDSFEDYDSKEYEQDYCFDPLRMTHFHDADAALPVSFDDTALKSDPPRTNWIRRILHPFYDFDSVAIAAESLWIRWRVLFDDATVEYEQCCPVHCGWLEVWEGLYERTTTMTWRVVALQMLQKKRPLGRHLNR